MATRPCVTPNTTKLSRWNLLARMTELNHQAEIGLLLHKENKNDDIWHKSYFKYKLLKIKFTLMLLLAEYPVNFDLRSDKHPTMDTVTTRSSPLF